MRTTFVSFQTLKRPALIGKTGFSQLHSVSSFLIRYGRISGQAQSLLEAAQSSAFSLSLCNRSRFFLSFFEKLLGAFHSDSIFLFTLFLDAGYIRQDLPNAVCFVQTKPDGDLLKDYLELVESRRPPLGVLHQCHCLNQKKKTVSFSIWWLSIWLVVRPSLKNLPTFPSPLPSASWSTGRHIDSTSVLRRMTRLQML